MANLLQSTFKGSGTRGGQIRMLNGLNQQNTGWLLVSSADGGTVTLTKQTLSSDAPEQNTNDVSLKFSNQGSRMVYDTDPSNVNEAWINAHPSSLIYRKRISSATQSARRFDETYNLKDTTGGPEYTLSTTSGSTTTTLMEYKEGKMHIPSLSEDSYPLEYEYGIPFVAHGDLEGSATNRTRTGRTRVLLMGNVLFYIGSPAAFLDITAYENNGDGLQEIFNDTYNLSNPPHSLGVYLAVVKVSDSKFLVCLRPSAEAQNVNGMNVHVFQTSYDTIGGLTVERIQIRQMTQQEIGMGEGSPVSVWNYEGHIMISYSVNNRIQRFAWNETTNSLNFRESIPYQQAIPRGLPAIFFPRTNRTLLWNAGPANMHYSTNSTQSVFVLELANATYYGCLSVKDELFLFYGRSYFYVQKIDTTNEVPIVTVLQKIKAPSDVLRYQINGGPDRDRFASLDSDSDMFGICRWYQAGNGPTKLYIYRLPKNIKHRKK